jgi:hypothetical protein
LTGLAPPPPPSQYAIRAATAGDAATATFANALAST